MSEVPILKETTRSTGREALRNNIAAAMALAGAVRSTLGPLGQDKLLIDDEGRTMVTNDGVTVLESAKVEHPVANMLINASTTQDRIARDGTTSAVLLSAELLQNAWELVLQGIHPSAIARGKKPAGRTLNTSLSKPPTTTCWLQPPHHFRGKFTKRCSTTSPLSPLEPPKRWSNNGRLAPSPTPPE